MAVIAPVLSTLPPPPLPSDAEAVFDAKAGASLTAQVVMVTEINAALSWTATQVNAAEGYKNAAATSAGNAADSAALAGQQVGLAADQVDLAVTARQGAESAATNAQTYAAAAGAAAGLPSLAGNALRVLGVNPNELGVSWVKALPVTTGKGGFTLQVNAAGTDYDWVSTGLFHIVDERASGVEGGSGSTSYAVRTLNTVKQNTIPGASLSASAFTLPAGKYRINAKAAAWAANRHKLRLYNVTAASVAAVGVSCGSATSSAFNVYAKLFVELEVLSPTTFRVEHRLETASGSNDLGRPCVFGDAETYATVTVQKVA
ncbi:hypothetical protein [Pseudomonas syringae]|uniref:Uncharacterized protein n=1 Tax=Pseudomonas syringae TaxID=317 RepID=A0A085V3Y9_PSESX|nr:hypothetical protein [Pseudomonas syringae]KFE50152.1 hypothetical protein IV01_26135 [Pseudomonas syringae]